MFSGRIVRGSRPGLASFYRQELNGAIGAVGVQQRVLLPKGRNLQLKEFVKRSQNHSFTFDDPGSPSLIVSPRSRALFRKQFFLAAEDEYLHRSLEIQLDLDDPASVRRQQRSSKAHDWKWAGTKVFDGSTGITTLDNKGATKLLSGNGIELDLDKLHYTDRTMTHLVLADLEVSREVFDVYEDGKDSTVLQLILESWKSTGYKHNGDFSRTDTFVEAWKLLKPTDSRVGEVKILTEKVDYIINQYTSILKRPTDLEDGMPQRYFSWRRAFDRAQYLSLLRRAGCGVDENDRERMLRNWEARKSDLMKKYKARTRRHKLAHWQYDDEGIEARQRRKKPHDLPAGRTLVYVEDLSTERAARGPTEAR